MKKSTEELLKTLKHAPDYDSYLKNEQENFTVCPLSDYLSALCAKKNTAPAQCISRSGLDRTYAYQIFSGHKNPTRDKVLALCFGFLLSLDETQTLLKCTGYGPLYPRDPKDSLIIFALQRNYSIADVNELLFEKGFPTLH